MPHKKIITRENIEARIPFCYGIIQRIADDLEVSHTAVCKFLNAPENADLRELIALEKNRIREYAEMTVLKHLISGDIETAKWFLSESPFEPKNKAPKPFTRRKNKFYEFILLNEKAPLKDIRELSFPLLDRNDEGLREGEEER
ncbi:MAG: hypothetical protein K1X86_10345 [Ignavibacteria bacterium]|nr:hypothetical protein [Ignavibacteria bacterium]